MDLLLETRHQSSGDTLIFREFAPCRPLRSHVVCYWSGQISAPPHAPYTHRVLPDGCTDIIFELSPASATAVVIGSMWRSRLVTSRGTPGLGVRFYPGAALTFLGCSLDNLQERVVPFREFRAAIADRLLDQLLATDGLVRRIAIVEAWLITQLGKSPATDRQMARAITCVYAERGRLRVSELAKAVGLSERQLSRKFPGWTGYTPKQFVRIMRFQHAFETVLYQPAMEDASIAALHGYADQSHMIREFEEFGGGTPRTLRRAACDNGSECPIFSIPTPGTLRYYHAP